jgi:hypothetical protein
MEKLRIYLNSLPADRREAYAKACGTSVGYLRKAISLQQRFDGALCRLLDKNSGGVIRKQDLRPDIWPELLEDFDHHDKRLCQSDRRRLGERRSGKDSQ